MARIKGGLAVGAIFTRSSSASRAIRMASLADMIPSCSPFTPMRRTSLSRICSLIIKSLIVVPSLLRKEKVDSQTIHLKYQNSGHIPYPSCR